MIDDAAKAAPDSTEPVILEAELLLAQEKADEARILLEKAGARFPKRVEIRVAQAKLLGSQGQLEKARKLLDRAQQELGDRVDLRLARAELEASQTGPEVVKALNGLAQNAGAFSKEDRGRLLEGLATLLVRQQDLDGASRLRTRLAEENPTDLKLRLALLDLAFQTASEAEIEKNIKEIERIEGSDGLKCRLSQLRFLIWQADQGSDKQKQEELRTSARELANELRSRRADSPLIPVSLAFLEEQELKGGLEEQKLKPGDLTENQIRAKEETIANYYVQAISLGLRNSAVLGRCTRASFQEWSRH